MGRSAGVWFWLVLGFGFGAKLAFQLLSMFSSSLLRIDRNGALRSRSYMI